ILAGFTTIRAPFPAVITRRWVNSGDTVRDAAMPLLTVQRRDVMRVLIDIPERDVRYLHTDSPNQKGNEAGIHIPTLETTEASFRGTLTLKADALDPVTLTMRTEVHLDNHKGLLKPHMTGTADVTLAHLHKVFTVPSSALVRTGKAVEIYYVADPKGNPPRGVVKRMEVQLGLDDGQQVQITGDQLTGKEWIIVRGSGMINVGDTAISVPLKKEENP